MDFPNFNAAYSLLNPEQKLAVDTVEGPVMVVAGAGTGKTQTIALRIANILYKTQTSPGSILCLTYTENAAINMRQRLLTIIGPTAYRVSIHTFHSFCNDLIKSYPQYFIFAPDIKPQDELEKIEIIKSLIDKLPPGASLRPWGDNYYYQKEIISRIGDLKRENITPATFLNLVEAQLTFINQSEGIYGQLKALKPGKNLASQLVNLTDGILKATNLSESIYNVIDHYFRLYQSDKFPQGRAKSPDVNYKNFLISFFENLKKNLPKQRELHQIYLNYSDELISRGRYDYDDMILHVQNAFKMHRELLLDNQEKYQYILVDEYQDTNSSQNSILDLLASYFDQPNLFVVGDDDQSIFRFQGAAIDNIYEFYVRYLKPFGLLPIVLRNNYRSRQLILDSSLGVINQNRYRIANLIPNIDKSLVACSTYDPTPLNIMAAPNPLSENIYIAQTIKQLLVTGVKPSEIAVLCRTNADLTDLLETFSAFGVTYHLETGQDILATPSIVELVTLLSYLRDPNSNHLLYRLLSYPFLRLGFVDLFEINQYCYHHHLQLSSLVLNSHLPESLATILKAPTLVRLKNFRRWVALAQKWQTIYSPDRYFNRVIRKFGYLSYLTSKNNIELINNLNCFYEEFKKQTLEEHATLPAFLTRLELMKENHISLFPSALDYDYSDCVRLMTVHKAKGLEFEHVFIAKFLDRKWGNNRHQDSLPVPWGLVKTDLALSQIEQDNEDERRLFYVALTRSKKQVYISFPTRTNSDRELLPSQFLSEINPSLVESVNFSSKDYKSGLLHLHSNTTSRKITPPNTANYLKNYLTGTYRFNVTHLNSYLRCPLCFYYQTILRIPSPKDKHSSLGTAVHRSLSFLFNTFKSTEKLIDLPELLSRFDQYLTEENLTPKDYEESLSRGRQLISGYYENYCTGFNSKVVMDYDFKSSNIRLNNIPLTGKIDKMEILTTTSKPDVNVVDFKTGNPDSKSTELRPGGEYYRQLVFYLLLGQLAPDFRYNIVSGTIDFISPSPRSGKFVRKTFDFTPQDISTLKAEIEMVYAKILALDFPGSPDCDDRQGYHQLN